MKQQRPVCLGFIGWLWQTPNVSMNPASNTKNDKWALPFAHIQGGAFLTKGVQTHPKKHPLQKRQFARTLLGAVRAKCPPSWRWFAQLFAFYTESIGVTWALQRPKSQNQSENEFPWPVSLGIQKSRRQGRKRVKIAGGLSRPQELILRLSFPTLGPKGTNDPYRKQTFLQGWVGFFGAGFLGVCSLCCKNSCCASCSLCNWAQQMCKGPCSQC